MGANFDGESDLATYKCPSSANFLMTQVLLAKGVVRDNSENFQRLSNCSIAAIKNLALHSRNRYYFCFTMSGSILIVILVPHRMTSKVSQCLVNVPPIQYYDSLTSPGRLWSADDQCKLIYGNQASFCRVNNNIDKIIFQPNRFLLS